MPSKHSSQNHCAGSVHFTAEANRRKKDGPASPVACACEVEGVWSQGEGCQGTHYLQAKMQAKMHQCKVRKSATNRNRLHTTWTMKYSVPVPRGP